MPVILARVGGCGEDLRREGGGEVGGRERRKGRREKGEGKGKAEG